MTVPDLMGTLDVAQLEQPILLKSRRPRSTNKGRTFPPDPIRINDFVALLEACTPQTPGRCGELSAMRLRTLMVVLYRTGIRISEALALEENDLIREEQALVIKHGKGDKRRIVLMDEWGWGEFEAWLKVRAEFPPGATFCVLRGRTAGTALFGADVRRQLRQARDRAGLRRRANPHSFRHGFAVDARREGIDYHALQKQLGHARLDVTETYLRGIDPMEVLEPFARRRPPMMVVPARRQGG